MNDIQQSPDDVLQCSICPHACLLREGQLGMCGARANRDGKIVCENYGLLTALALDPIEKKPLHMFYPGSMVLSLGSYGCNLNCEFCQNSDISMARGLDGKNMARYCVSPQEIVNLGVEYMNKGNIGLAYTYNEPFISFEFLRDTMPLARESGLKNVLVTNGYVCDGPLLELLPYTDAMNIDLKGFSQEFYDFVGAPEGLFTVKRSITLASSSAHVEVTTLVIPGKNDSEQMMEDEAKWLASVDPTICLHITRFFPRHKMLDRLPTPIDTLEKLAGVAGRYLDNVVIGNI